ncbi:unnamed protein product [Mytilus coruscus]|uniref:C2H2-type domain-containing protein n=1 Tax=Mytilus coruscus TaxID=42192 RepID=A0A6J8A2K5_MYTCO|nr:unnamed protein product [Mytilus coruscus]
MKKALESYNGGVKGTNVCVVSIDQASEPKIKSRIPGISVLSNFAFIEIGIVARKAYQVGSGQLKQTGISDQNLCKERVFNLEVHEPFTVIQTAGKVSHLKTAQHFANEHDEPSAIPENETTNACDSQTVNFFCCPDISCNKTFARATNLEKHILIGNHSYRTNKSLSDNAVEVYASISESVQDTQINLIQTVSAATQSDATSNMINKGWALKGKRTNICFSPKVKSYLNEICLNCEKTGKRPNYFALSDELRKSCDENGERMFKMEEWLNPTQIKSYFATLVTKLKSGTINFNSITDNNDVQSVELKEIEENVEQDEKLYEAVAVIEANTHNENVENFVDDVYTAVNM